MGIDRRIRRNNNMAGLRAQLQDKEKEIYMLSQQQDMQRTYFDEITKISTALKDILLRELKLSEEDLMKMLEAELDVTEAAEIDEVIKAEEPSIEIVDDSETIEHIITEGDIKDNPGEDLVEGETIGIPKEAVKAVKEKKPRKKKVSKDTKK